MSKSSYEKFDTPTYRPHMSLSNKKWKEAFLKIFWLTFFTPQFLRSSHDARFFNTSNLWVICSQTPPPHEPDVFWHRCSSVCSRIGQRHRVQQVDITRIGREERATSLRLPERPAHQVNSPLSTRRLAGHALVISTLREGMREGWWGFSCLLVYWYVSIKRSTCIDLINLSSINIP